ncbi:MAG: Holliday junction branch migration protein RuvA [Alphaproteobacteria bacterium]|nr:Holliday junction branch migration protein RuvA [Alphaproteobacteria bacterium]
MIGKIIGVVDTIRENTVILMTQSGVGYRIHTTGRQGFQKGETVSLYIQTIVREDAFQLYGFQNTSEQDAFLLLTTVQGVGNRVGMTILSSLSEEQVYQALTTGDEAVFKSVSGIGPKLAKRIVSELKDKVGGMDLFVSQGVIKPQSSVEAEMVSAMVNLGYKSQYVIPFVKKLVQENPEISIEKAIPMLLNNLSS